MKAYEAVIGLEVHAQLLTRSKLFCACPTRFGDEPNANVCPVCAGMPGVLPVLNALAVEYACKMALAVGCRINRTSLFARKNYFYPDLPKGYQISQYEAPLAEAGVVEIEGAEGPRRLRIRRIHMEDDAGKNIHSAAENKSFVDLNRTGVPLIEIVSEPDMRTPEEAVAYLKVLHGILTWLGICDGNMEEGSFRCDANVSLRPVGQQELGIRTELKNMNSFRFVQKAIEFEIERHRDVLEAGETVVQETRLFDSDKGITLSMRGKEEAHDYRYFPEPDLVPLRIGEERLEAWRRDLPELPQARRRRFVEVFGLSPNDAETLTAERSLADYFEAAVREYDAPRKIANWVLTEFLRELRRAGLDAAGSPLPPAGLAGLVRLVDDGVISGKIGKDLFPELFRSGASPAEFVRAKGLVQISDAGALEEAVDRVLAGCPAEVAAFRAGKDKLMGFFVGQVMKATRGKANPALVNDLLRRKLG